MAFSARWRFKKLHGAVMRDGTSFYVVVMQMRTIEEMHWLFSARWRFKKLHGAVEPDGMYYHVTVMQMRTIEEIHWLFLLVGVSKTTRSGDTRRYLLSCGCNADEGD